MSCIPIFIFNSFRCCFFGDISSKRDPEAYLNCLFHLYDYFVGKYRCNDNAMLPLIVNTPGWVKGISWSFQSWFALSYQLPQTCFSENITLFLHLYFTGAGFDMLVEMLRYICPTTVVQIRITMESKNLPDGMFWLDGEQTGPKMININAAFRDASNRS